jgi:hypothetical protein
MSGSGLEFLTDLLPWSKRRPRIFISYRRRGDSAGFAARLADRLVAHFGDEQCFRDIEDIESGMDFVEAIEDAVASSRVMVAVIGTDWVTVKGADGRRRLDNPDDFVRIEVATALRRGIRVIPVLVAGATMPSGEGLPAELQGLWRRQALELSDNRWDYDVGQLTSAIEGMGIRNKQKRAATVLARRLRWGGIAAAAAMVVLFGIGLIVDNLDTRRGGASLPTNPLGAGAAIGAPAQDPGVQGSNDPASRDAREVVSEPVRQPSVRSSPIPAEKAPVERSPVERALPPPSAVDRYRDALVAAIDEGNEAQNYAQETLDISGLAEIFTGDALQMHVVSVGQLFQGGEVSFNTLLSQRYGEFRIDPTETTAQVDVVERWAAEHLNALTGMCMHRIPAWDVPQTVHLRRMGTRWFIENVTGDPVTIPDALGC